MQYIVFLGFSGSGKSTLSNPVLSLPQTVYAPEYCILGAVGQVYASIQSENIRNALKYDIKRNLVTFANSRENRGRYKKLYRAIKHSSSPIDFVKRLSERSINLLVYESNFMTFCPQLIFEALDEAKIVLLHRDGRDCARIVCGRYNILKDSDLIDQSASETLFSTKKIDCFNIPWWVEEGKEQLFLDSTQFVRAMWMWKAMVQRTQAFTLSPEVEQSSRVLTLKYEDIIANTLQTVQLLEEFLGLSLSASAKKKLIKASEQRARAPQNLPKVSSEELEIAEELAKSELEALGYL